MTSDSPSPSRPPARSDGGSAAPPPGLGAGPADAPAPPRARAATPTPSQTPNQTPNQAPDQTAPAAPAAPGLARLAVLLTAFATVEALILAGPGRLTISQMEADVLHLLDAMARIGAGQRPHLDFGTPLGALSFLPFTIWEAPPARALALGNILVTAALIPWILWLRASRLSHGQALGLGVMAMIVAAAATWAPDSQALTFAMYYNRWGWALFMVAAPILMLAPRDGTRADAADGVAIGLAAAALLHLKITYAAFAAPLWLVWLLTTRRWRAAALSVLVGAAAAAALFAATGGLAEARGYVLDLWAAATSHVRPAPGRSPAQVAATPASAPLTVALLIAALTLAKAGLRREALLFGTAGLAIIGIAWQNFGNHMIGALVAPPLLLALAPRADPAARGFGLPAPRLLRLTAAALVFMQLPGLATFERSLFGGWTAGGETKAALFATSGAPGLFFDDLRGATRGILPTADTETTELDARRVAGRRFPPCTAFTGYESLLAEVGEALRGAPALAGRTVLTADLVDPVWWIAGAPPMRGAQLWRYAPLGPALDRFELLAVAGCPVDLMGRNRTLDEIAEAGIALRPVLETPNWTVFERLSQ